MEPERRRSDSGANRWLSSLSSATAPRCGQRGRLSQRGAKRGAGGPLAVRTSKCCGAREKAT